MLGSPCATAVGSHDHMLPNQRFDQTRSGGLRPPTRAGQAKR